jgi:hypothetical protein
MTLSINDTQHNNNLPLCRVSRLIADYAECHYAQCSYVECRFAEDRGALSPTVPAGAGYEP